MSGVCTQPNACWNVIPERELHVQKSAETALSVPFCIRTVWMPFKLDSSTPHASKENGVVISCPSLRILQRLRLFQGFRFKSFHHDFACKRTHLLWPELLQRFCDKGKVCAISLFQSTTKILWQLFPNSRCCVDTIESSRYVGARSFYMSRSHQKMREHYVTESGEYDFEN